MYVFLCSAEKQGKTANQIGLLDEEVPALDKCIPQRHDIYKAKGPAFRMGLDIIQNVR